MTPMLRRAYRNKPAQADDRRERRVMVTGRGGGQGHLRDAPNILAKSRLRDERMPAALGQRMADRTRARSQWHGVYRTASPEPDRE